MRVMGEKPRNTKTKIRKKSTVWLPSHSTKRRPTGFWCPNTPKTRRTYPKWERVPNLMGQKKRQGWVRYGQLIADNMTFIHVKFQDLQQKRAGVMLEVQKIGMGKILEINN